jgi:hypothetical protein
MTSSGRPVSYISRLSFDTDMTRTGRSLIQLGVMIEAVWPDCARWLGIIGRTELTPHELEKVNLHSWPELREPSEFLERLFKEGWESEWGEAGSSLVENWGSSALIIATTDHSRILDLLEIDTEAGWATTTGLLSDRLENFSSSLEPEPPPVFSGWVKTPTRPASRRAPMARKWREGFKWAA